MDSTGGPSDIEEIVQQNSSDEIPTEVTPMQPMQTMEPSHETETRAETTEPDIEPPPKKGLIKKLLEHNKIRRKAPGRIFNC
jgi:hypothetical protein